MDASGLISYVMRQGVHGDKETIAKWVLMLIRMAREGLPENIAEYQNYFQQDVQTLLGDEDLNYWTKNEQKLMLAIDAMVKEKKIEIIDPFQEFRLANHKEWVFYGKDKDIFFTASDLQAQPLQFIRSRVKNFCEMHRLSEATTDEIIISVTEAAENAIKYSNRYVWVFHHEIQGSEYKIRAINSVKDIDLQDEIQRGKFSEDVSLMRGVLVMSRLLDKLDLERDTQKKRVEFYGIKKIA
ncbi:MAG: hypothetical protein D6767_03085 [Candidatus Hydrogenedentota bacterium]|nr:MAG: hypothetical protein D6767_03085 [Candidatus Hydrogenedentota bacterium]